MKKWNRLLAILLAIVILSTGGGGKSRIVC